MKILLDFLDALAHAHARGMIHRDIKPANVLLDTVTGHVKISDFGLVHSAEFVPRPGHQVREISQAEDDQSISGTPAYMAPEQIQADWRRFGPWTDLYAVGAMAWKLSTGRPPYPGDINKVFEGHLRGHLPDLSAVHEPIR